MTAPIQSYWASIELMWEQINIYEGEATFLISIQPLPRPVVLLYAAHFCQSEVCNGGFFQFFWNSTGILCAEAIEGFRLIGMPQLASVVEAAAALLGPTYQRDRRLRWNAMLDATGLEKKTVEEIFQKESKQYQAYEKATMTLGWRDLNNQFYQLIESENGGFQSASDRYASWFASIGNN
jgi:hypothetical protein